MTKTGKIILFSSIGIVLIGSVAGVAIYYNRKKKNKTTQQGLSYTEQIMADLLGGTKGDSKSFAEKKAWLIAHMNKGGDTAQRKKEFADMVNLKMSNQEVSDVYTWMKTVDDAGGNAANLKYSALKALHNDVNFMARIDAVSKKYNIFT